MYFEIAIPNEMNPVFVNQVFYKLENIKHGFAISRLQLFTEIGANNFKQMCGRAIAK